MINPSGHLVVGKKGRSGRKSAHYESIKRQTIEKAWLKVHRELETKSVEKVALPIALKDMGERQEVSGEINFKPIYGGRAIIQGHISDTKDIPVIEENQSSERRDISV